MRAKGISLRDKFACLYGYGHSLTDIAREHNMSRDTVIALLTAIGLKNIEEVCPTAIPEPVEEPRSARPFRSRWSLPIFGRRSPVVCPVDPPARDWCTQCERLVAADEANECTSKWCKAKELAA